MYLEYIKLVLEDINRRKFSSFLTLFAISLGILTIFVIFLLGAGFESSIEEQFNQFGSNRIYITSSTQSFGSTTAVKGLTDNEVRLVENRPYVQEVYPYYARVVQLKYGNEFQQDNVFGTYLSEDFFQTFDLDVTEGRFPKTTEKYSVMIGPNAAEDLFSQELRVGSNIYVKDTKFKVVGILDSVGNPEDDSMLYFNINTLRDLYNGGDNVGYLDVVVVEGYDVEIASANLKILLENKLGEDSVQIVTPSQLLDQVGSILDIVKLTLGGIAFVALIVGALGIINTMYVIVTEKKKDIGIMKSIGAKNGDILFMFVFQAGFFGLLGAILGVIFGSGVAMLFEVFAKSAGYAFLEITINPITAVELLIFGTLIGCFAGFTPAYRASRTNIIDSIRK